MKKVLTIALLLTLLLTGCGKEEPKNKVKEAPVAPQNETTSEKNEVIENEIITENDTEDGPATACVPKKFENTYSYIYDNEEDCKKGGNNAFMDITDSEESSIFSYGCEMITDDCGDTFWGVYFNTWDEENEVQKVYY